VTDPIEGFTTATEPPTAGRLLVATADLRDPSFRGSVVLLLDHDEDGSLGVILNRPTPIVVSSVLPAWTPTVSPPEVLFEGGPVSRDSALAVARVPRDVPEPVGFRRIVGDLGIVDLDTPTDVVAEALTGMRVFAGYSGWGAGQLETEIEERAWYVVDSVSADVFLPDVSRLRQDVLRRQPGELAWVSTRPEDPNHN
jgi:putative transcriptional regulator